MKAQRAKRLRRRARALAEALAPEKEVVPFSAPLTACGVNPATAELMLRLDQQVAAGRAVPGELLFPGTEIGGIIGPSRPMPVLGLLALWRAGPPFAVPCPGCGELARVVRLGGGLALGGGWFVCSGCDRAWSQRTGGWSAWSSAMPAGVGRSLRAGGDGGLGGLEQWLTRGESGVQ